MKTPLDIVLKKGRGEKVIMLTAYDYSMARLLDQAEIDMILVGDSLGNVIQGHPTTIPVTVDHIIYHTQAVARGVSNALIVADMPYMSYHVSTADAVRNAGRLIKEGGAHVVKLEILSQAQIPALKAIRETGIPVMAHIGFTPQNVYELGGFKVQGRSSEAVANLVQLAQACEAAGAFACVEELIPDITAREIQKSVSMVTIGIGASDVCDGQVLVLQDLLGMTDRPLPKFVTPYCQLFELMKTAVVRFRDDVRAGQYPTKANLYE